MINWGMKYLETVLGKTIVGIIGVFVLGVFAMWSLPKYIVTTEVFEQKVKSIYKKMDKGDKLQELNLINMEKEYWNNIKWDLLKEINESGTSATTAQSILIDKAIKKLEILEEKEAKIKENL